MVACYQLKICNMPEVESISRKDCLAHSMCKAKSSEAIRQAKQFSTGMGKHFDQFCQHLIEAQTAMKLTADWVCGFVDGEGTFWISIEPQPKMKLGQQARIGFKITQGVKNLQILYSVKEMFGVGTVKSQRADGSVWEYRVSNFDTMCTKIIPFFERHPLHTYKKFDFLRVRSASLLIKRGLHLTPAGLEKIVKMREKMNKTHPVQPVHTL